MGDSRFFSWEHCCSLRDFTLVGREERESVCVFAWQSQSWYLLLALSLACLLILLMTSFSVCIVNDRIAYYAWRYPKSGFSFEQIPSYDWRRVMLLFSTVIERRGFSAIASSSIILWRLHSFVHRMRQKKNPLLDMMLACQGIETFFMSDYDHGWSSLELCEFKADEDCQQEGLNSKSRCEAIEI